jgi:hypothetical protein
MDKFQFSQMGNSQPVNVQRNPPDLAQMLNQARRDPKAFEENFKRTNPQAYQQALQLRNSFSSPQQIVMQMAQQRGINPSILQMLDL